jgi:molybdenum cofactor cytidylyltransferase
MRETSPPPSVEGVILAAGLSTRSGKFKMALSLGDRTLIQRSVEGMYDAVERIWVVVGWQAARVRELLAPYARVELVLNKNYGRGMFSSVKVGLAQVNATRAFLQPGDCAFISPEVYGQMLVVDGEIVIPTFDGRKGHPVLFHHTVLPEILALPDDAILRDYIQAKGFTPLRVKDKGILVDVDTPEDYETLQARYHL